LEEHEMAQQQQQQQSTVHDAAAMTFRQRLQVTLQLWPYMVPLFVVYSAEYAMQSGTWTAIGFPVTSAAARHKFYLYSNWMYQAGEKDWCVAAISSEVVSVGLNTKQGCC
jgi:hypothetical protein